MAWFKAYDELNRLLSLTAPDLAIGYTYDAVGNMLTMTDATGTTSYTYDALNRLTNITYPTGLTVGYTYNEVGRITSIATPYGGVAYAYDDANRLTTITLPNNQQVVYQYDAAGNLLQVDYPNGTAAAYAYDTRNRLTAMTNFAPANTVISTYAYTLDGVGNRTRVDLNEPMMPSYNAETIDYTYTLGNILATVDGATYTHDANGNRTQKSGSGGTTTYTYDSLNRLVQVVKGSQINQYIYNGQGQRVGGINNGIQTNYLIDPNGILPKVLAETDTSNNLISFYVYDGVGLVAKVTPENNYYFYHYDGLGSTIAVSDSTGQVVNTYCYSPEGLVGAQETIPNPFTYVGRYGVMAEGNGLYKMGVRYYDPEVGRFITKDPIGFAGGDTNLYAYVGNNPINRLDYYGLKAERNGIAFFEIGASLFWNDFIIIPSYTKGTRTQVSYGIAVEYKNGKITKVEIYRSVIPFGKDNVTGAGAGLGFNLGAISNTCIEEFSDIFTEQKSLILGIIGLSEYETFKGTKGYAVSGGGKGYGLGYYQGPVQTQTIYTREF